MLLANLESNLESDLELDLELDLEPNLDRLLGAWLELIRPELMAFAALCYNCIIRN